MKLLYFQMMKRNILVPFRTTKGFHLPITFIGLADLFPKLGSWHVQLCLNNMYLALMVQRQITYFWRRWPEISNPWVKFDIIILRWQSWEPRFKSGFHSFFGGIIFVQRPTAEWLWKYLNEIWDEFWLIL